MENTCCFTDDVSHTKFTISNCDILTRNEILKSFIRIAPNVMPLQIKYENSTLKFNARIVPNALDNLSKNNFLIDVSPFLLNVRVDRSAGSLKDAITAAWALIAKVTESRRTSVTLNMDNFADDSAFGDVVYFSLSQPFIMQSLANLMKSMGGLFRILTLRNNDIKNIQALTRCKTLYSLDLRDNQIETDNDISSLKSFPHLTAVWLDGNPLCARYNSKAYIAMVRSYCPKLERLDDRSLAPGTEYLPRKNYFMSTDALHFVDEFLQHFYTLYDHQDRSLLADMYHEHALCSLTSHMSNPANLHFSHSDLEVYQSRSRNLLRIVDMAKQSINLYVGVDDILILFKSLPLTDHDPHTFTVDCMHWSMDNVVVTVSGLFREKNYREKFMRLFSFTRTFVLAASGLHGEYKIVNELFHVTNASSAQSANAFKNYTELSTINFNALEHMSGDEKTLMVKIVANITSLDATTAMKLLVEYNWNLKVTLNHVSDYYKNV